MGQAQALDADPETLPKVRDLRARLAEDAVDLDGLEAEVYDHLFSFFRRYYSERAEYGRRLIDDLSSRLTERYGRGFSTTNLRYFRNFHQVYAGRTPEMRHTASGVLQDLGSCRASSTGILPRTTPTSPASGARRARSTAIEQRLGGPRVALDSFIVSNTPSHVMRKQWGIEKPEMVRRHVLFQDEDKASYIGAMLQGLKAVGP